MDNFRNETLNGLPHDFEVEDVSSGGVKFGNLEFDFVSTNIDHRFALTTPMSESIFTSFKIDLTAVKHQVQVHQTHKHGHNHRRQGDALIIGDNHAANPEDYDTDEEERAAVEAQQALATGPELVVQVISGQGLLAMDKRGTSDPYVVVRLGGLRVKTKVKKKTLSPEWNETFQFRYQNDRSYLKNKDEALYIECFDWDLHGDDDPMGDGSVAMRDIRRKAAQHATKDMSAHQEVRLLFEGEEVGSLQIWVRLWHPTLSRLTAVVMMQSKWRQRSAHKSVSSFRFARKEITRTNSMSGQAVQQRMAEHEKLRERARTQIETKTPSVLMRSNLSVDLPADGDGDDSPSDSNWAEEEHASPSASFDFRRANWQEQLKRHRTSAFFSRTRQYWWVPSFGMKITVDNDEQKVRSLSLKMPEYTHDTSYRDVCIKPSSCKLHTTYIYMTSLTGRVRTRRYLRSSSASAR